MRIPSSLLLAIALGVAPAAAAPQWQALPAAPISIRMDDLHFLDANQGWVITGEGGIHHTLDGGATWTQQLDDPTVYFRCIRFADAQHGWAGTLSSEALLYHTTNGGADWTLVANIPEPRPNALCGMWAASSQVIYGVGSYAGPARLIKSVDGGANWTSKDLAPLATSLVDVYFKSPTEGLAVGGLDGFPDQSHSVVLRTTDGGVTWQQRYVGPRAGEWGWKITFPTPSIGYVSLERFDGPMFFLRTTDGGLTWTELPLPNYNTQGIGFVTPDIGWVGGAGNPTLGTIDGGVSWSVTPWGEYLNRFQFLTPTLGYGSGVTVYKYAEAMVTVPDEPVASRAVRAVPNPFASRTTIRFTLQEPAHLRLFIVDPSGRKVRQLADGPRGGGSQVVEWDGRTDRGTRAPAGIYLYVLHAGDRHEMGKLVLVP